MDSLIIKNTSIVNEGKIIQGDVWIKNGKIQQIDGTIDANAKEIDGEGLHLMPGIIDDQVHFRDPGLTHKGDLYTEPKAAVAGGVTSFMEMPNTKPPALTQELLEEKYQTAAQKSLANYSFFMGASNDNLDEVLKTDPTRICGIKAFMGSSTGNMLVDNPVTLEDLFKNAPCLIATHCEDETTIRENLELFKAKYGEQIPMDQHPIIRSPQGCLISSSLAMDLAKKNDARLHILHISTKDELSLFRNDIPLKDKRITSEVCVHHLYFNASQYASLGSGIKCNPAIKSADHQEALFPALLDNRLDIIATDHAPHTIEEKANPYLNCPSGVPLIQHSLTLMLDFYHKGKISLERIVEKMCHAPAICFDVAQRGYLREGYFADLVLVDINKEWEINKDNIHYKCGWSPLEGQSFRGQIQKTFINGHLAYDNGKFDESKLGMRLEFDR